MQTIKHPKNYKYIHPIFSEFERLYTALSNNDQTKLSCLFDADGTFETSLRPFEDVFNEYGNCEIHLNYSDKNYPKLPMRKYNKKNVIVAFSGGKDSTAVALYYKDKGFNVYLYHVHGLNRFFPQEQQSAEQVAEYLNLPMIVEDVNLSGVSLYPDHPLKNIIIANMALQWGIENNVGAFITFGDYYTAYLDDVCFETSGDDCIEMWKIYKPVMKKCIPQFRLEIPLVNVADTLERLKSDKTLLGLTQSCVMTHRFKDYHSKRVQDKYNIKLLPNRCGTCWKCALEYIYYTDHGVLDYNREYYKYCIQILRRTLKNENGIRIKNERTVWERFMFYSVLESRYFND